MIKDSTVIQQEHEKKILFKCCDGPEGLEIYTSEQQAITDWATDYPALYLIADIQGSHVRLGPFQISKIRKSLEKLVEGPVDELGELKNTASDWQKQFHQLKALCEQKGIQVGYGEKGEVVFLNSVQSIANE
jgi:hypothetical protein